MRTVATQRFIAVRIVLFLSLLPAGGAFAQPLQPGDLEYAGAFRLPDWPDPEIGWPWGGSALAYYPGGDPSGPNDGCPGSLFGTGHDWNQYVSEISIPRPVISPGKNLSDLNTASTLQGFRDIRGGLFPFSSYELPRVGLEYLPPQGGQSAGKLYFCWGQHNQEMETTPSHGWCGLNLEQPGSVGPWRIDNLLNYVTNDYIFSIPPSWADAHVPGMYLATGRFRDGGQGGEGPSLIAYSPGNQGNPPPAQATLPAAPLLLYGNAYEPNPPAMVDYHHSDEWSGGAWLTAGVKSAVIFVGTKGLGDCWYGCPDGTVWEPPYPPSCPDRGWWSTYFAGRFVFYDPSDFAAVAAGQMPPHQPQPYAAMDIDSVLFAHPGEREKYHTGGCAFDRDRGLLYLFEPLADGDKPLVHVWKVHGNGGAPTPVPAPTPPPPPPFRPVFPSGDYNGDGTTDIAIFRGSSGMWLVRNLTRAYFGSSTDYPLPADYDGDGTTDIAIFRESFGMWSVRNLSRFYLGSGGDAPVPGDYDGDGTSEAGIFRESFGMWSIRNITRIYFGATGDTA
ncbi:MAG: VCBS repeat-containing protein, partial [Candidatus Aureabacteria bacterium]|nr:VCBS repeat-containing protein [Candidatus Auribacterota bacterium]